MSRLRKKNTVFLFRTQTSAGTQVTPSASTDAVLASDLTIRRTLNVQQTSELNGSLDATAPITAGESVELEVQCLLKGSGVAETPPEFGDLIRSCGFQEVITSAAVPVAAEACQSGGSTSTARLGTTAGTTVNQYLGMPLLLSGDMTATSFIADYTAGKVATLTDLLAGSPGVSTNYQIPRNVSYLPASGVIPYGSAQIYMDGIMYDLFDLQGDLGLRLDTNQPGMITFSMRGRVGSAVKSDQTLPVPTYDATRPPPFFNGRMLVNRLEQITRSLTLGANNQIILPENPNTVDGYNSPVITGRNLTGNIDPLMTLVATQNLLADARAGTQRILHARYGTAAGNRVALTVPRAQFTNENPEDRDGLLSSSVPFSAVGRDNGFALTFW